MVLWYILRCVLHYTIKEWVELRSFGGTTEEILLLGWQSLNQVEYHPIVRASGLNQYKRE
jgi:hypothetical protein